MDFSEIHLAVDEGKKILGELKKKYPTLRAQLCISNRFGQMDVSATVLKALIEFPKLFIDSEIKKFLLPLAQKVHKMESRLHSTHYKDRPILKTNIEILSASINSEGPFMALNEAFVEFIFDELNYELIWRLQFDQLIDRHHTPQSKSSIRIVIGTLEELKSRKLARESQ